MVTSNPSETIEDCDVGCHDWQVVDVWGEVDFLIEPGCWFAFASRLDQRYRTEVGGLQMEER